MRAAPRDVHPHVAVADEHPQHREVVPAAPCLHVQEAEVVQGFSHDFLAGCHRRRVAAAGDVHVPHQHADAARKLRSIAVVQVEGLPVHVHVVIGCGGPGACLHKGSGFVPDVPEAEVRAASGEVRVCHGIRDNVSDIDARVVEAFPRVAHLRAEDEVGAGGGPEGVQKVAELEDVPG